MWSRTQELSLRDRSVVTVISLTAQGLVDESFRYHLRTAKQNGVTADEMAEILTHAAFYVGWPKVWAAFRMAKEVYAEPGRRGEGRGFPWRESPALPRACLFPESMV